MFKEKWESAYVFVESKNIPECLVSVSKAHFYLPLWPLWVFEQVTPGPEWVIVWGGTFAIPGTGGGCGFCVLWTGLWPPELTLKPYHDCIWRQGL